MFYFQSFNLTNFSKTEGTTVLKAYLTAPSVMEEIHALLSWLFNDISLLRERFNNSAIQKEISI